MIFKMALKNLFANKSKTVIILSLISIGTFLIVLGMGILNFAFVQTEKVCISDFCGNVLVTGKTTKSNAEVTLLGLMTTVSFGSSPKMPYLSELNKIEEKLSKDDNVKSFAKSIVEDWSVLEPVDLPDNWENENFSGYPWTRTLGVQVEEYAKVFDTIKIYEGQLPTGKADTFVVIPKKLKEKYEKFYSQKLKVGDEIRIKSYGVKPKILKLKVSGFFEFAHPDSTASSRIIYMDLNSCRTLADMTMGAKTVAEIPESVDLSITEMSEDDLFGGSDDIMGNSDVYSTSGSDDVLDILGSTELRDSLNMTDTESFHHIAIKLKNQAKTKSFIDELNQWFEEENINAQALNWEKAMLIFASEIKATRVLLTIVLIFLAVVVLIVIMNTLVVSIMERTSEIGTMRAIGAGRNHVRSIFFAESFVMTAVGVVIGIALAVVASLVFNSVNIRFNDIMAHMFGGYTAKVQISIFNMLVTGGVIIIAGVLANIYPIGIALKISPLEAINK